MLGVAVVLPSWHPLFLMSGGECRARRGWVLNQTGFRREKLTWSGKNVFFTECCGFEEEPRQH